MLVLSMPLAILRATSLLSKLHVSILELSSLISKGISSQSCILGMVYLFPTKNNIENTTIVQKQNGLS